jgi:hypothetical protein
MRQLRRRPGGVAGDDLLDFVRGRNRLLEPVLPESGHGRRVVAGGRERRQQVRRFGDLEPEARSSGCRVTREGPQRRQEGVIADLQTDGEEPEGRLAVEPWIVGPLSSRSSSSTVVPNATTIEQWNSASLSRVSCMRAKKRVTVSRSDEWTAAYANTEA